MPHKPHDPETPEQWQEAIDFAELFLNLESARLYGLIESDFKVDRARCEELLERGRALGYQPPPLADLIRRYLT